MDGGVLQSWSREHKISQSSHNTHTELCRAATFTCDDVFGVEIQALKEAFSQLGHKSLIDLYVQADKQDGIA